MVASSSLVLTLVSNPRVIVIVPFELEKAFSESEPFRRTVKLPELGQTFKLSPLASLAEREARPRLRLKTTFFK